MAKITKKGSKTERPTDMSLEDIRKLVDNAIKQNPIVFNRLAKI